MSKKAILLIRVSTETQDLVQQREKVVDAAIRDGFKEKDLILIEDKESAVKLSEEERNGLNRLKEHILNDSSIDTVYAYEISRISRQAKVVFSIRDFLIEHHIQLIVLNPYFKMLKDDGSLSETSNIFFGIFASMAENEGFIRKARMKRGKEKSKAQGKHYTGRIPFGYGVNKDKTYCIDPDAAPIVKKIYSMYVDDDMSLNQIGKELRSQGYFTHQTPHTNARMVQEILHREYYCGTVKGIPAIITKDIYDKAQALIRHKTITVTRTPAKALLKGIMYNRDSGHMLQVNTALKTYYCKNGGGVSVCMSVIEPIIWDIVVRIHKEFYSKDYEGAIAESTRMIQLAMRKCNTWASKIQEYTAQIERLEERVILGKLSASKADQMEASINANLEEAKKNYKKSDDDLKRYEDQSTQVLNESEKQFDYEKFTLDDKIELVKKVIEKVILWRDEDKVLHIELYNKYTDKIERKEVSSKGRRWLGHVKKTAKA